MKRSTFLTTLAAISTAPLLSFKKDELKDVPIKRATLTTISGEKTEPYIIRQCYRVSREERLHSPTYREEWIEDSCIKQMMHVIKQCPHLRKAKIVNPDGSLEYHYMLKLLPNA